MRHSGHLLSVADYSPARTHKSCGLQGGPAPITRRLAACKQTMKQQPHASKCATPPSGMHRLVLWVLRLEVSMQHPRITNELLHFPKHDFGAQNLARGKELHNMLAKAVLALQACDPGVSFSIVGRPYKGQKIVPH